MHKKIVTEKPVGIKLLRTPWDRWEDNIKKGLKDVRV
jgi:hypothetical protein